MTFNLNTCISDITLPVHCIRQSFIKTILVYVIYLTGACSSGYSAAALTWSNMGQGWHLGNPDKTADQVNFVSFNHETSQ